MWTVLHDPAIEGPAVYDLFNIFQNNRFGFNIVFDKFVIVCKHLLYHIHENIME